MEISPFLARRLARRFATLDADGDGRLERSDFELSVARIGAEFGHGPGSAARQRLLELSLGLWDHLISVADNDRDGTISLAEYQAAFAAGLLETEDSFVHGYRLYLDAIMAIADTDGDGRLTAEEHVRWTGSLMNLSESVARGIHARLDTDGDGYITTDDLLTAIHDFYFDDDPEGPGSWLLGPLDG